MNKLRQQENNYFITSKKNFNKIGAFKPTTIQKVFDFAYDMTYGEGEHRNYRSGGSERRKKGKQFINTFQGKLSELAVFNQFHQNNRGAYNKLSEPDFDVYELGKWDDFDMTLGEIKFSIKSTKFYGNLMLLETKDWDENGEYLPNKKIDTNCRYDYFVLVRIKPDGEKIMTSHRLLDSNEYLRHDSLFSIIGSNTWEYDIAGYITHQDLTQIIKNKFILPKSSLLNGRITMDAENYYIQSGDMRDLSQLIMSL